MTDKTIDGIWEEALEIFRNETGKNLRMGPAMKLEDIQKMLEVRSQTKDREENSKTSLARDRGLRILSTINNLGEVVTEVAAMAFGPAEICFKSISFLLEIPRKIKDFHEVIDDIFIKIEPTLSSFKIYRRIEQREKLDADLLEATHKVMAGLVKIFAKAINIEHGGKWQRFKAHASRVLSDDKELEEELERFESLVRGHQTVQGAVVLESVTETKGNVSTLLKVTGESSTELKNISKGMQDDKAEKEKKARMKKIRTALGIKEGVPDHSKEAVEGMLKRRVDGTGKWFEKVDTFKSWADSESSSSEAFLLLKGSTGFGKSYSVASIVDYLRTQASKSTGRLHRTLTAFYFFPALTGKADDESNPVEMALKWIAVQLSELDDAYAKSLGDLDQLDSVKVPKLWEALRLSSAMPRTTHYLIFDGLENLLDNDLQKLLSVFNAQLTSSKGTSPSSVRILASGKSDTFNTGPIALCPEMVIDSTIIQDELSLYIRHKLQAPSILPGNDQASVKMREEIETKLLQNDTINFRRVEEKLDGVETKITSGESYRDIGNLLSSIDDADTRVRIVRKLEAELNPGQVGLVNDLLVWVVFGKESFTVQQLEAALYLHDRDLPLQGLETFIKTRLKNLIAIESSGKVVLADQMEEVIKKPRNLSRQTTEKTISLKIEINNADITTVQRFFWDLTKFSTLENFSFQSSDAAAPGIRKKGSIRVNEIDASLAIVQAALKLLENQPDPKSAGIAEYLVEFLTSHLTVLRTAEGDDAVSAQVKSDIGKRIFEIFADPNTIKRHWETFVALPEFIDQKAMSEFREWLMDPIAIGGLFRKDRDQLTYLKDSQDWEQTLLQPVMKMMAHFWLRKDTMYTHQSFRWFTNFLSRIPKLESAGSNPSDSTTSKESTPTPADSETRTVDVAEAVAWCQKFLDIKEDALDALWFQQVGRTYFKLDEPQKAIDNLHKADELSDPNRPGWILLSLLIYALCELGPSHMEEASTVLRREIELYRDDKDVKLEDIVVDIRRVADAYKEQNQPGLALEWLTKAHEIMPDQKYTEYNIYALYVALERENECRELISKALAAKDIVDENNTDRFSSLIDNSIATNIWERADKIAWRTAAIVADLGRLDVLFETVEKLTEEVKKWDDNLLVWRLIYSALYSIYKGMAHLQDPGKGPDTLSNAFKCWDEARDIIRSADRSEGSWTESVYTKIAMQADKYHFNLATERGPHLETITDEADTHIQEIENSATEYKRLYKDLPPASAYLASIYVLKGDQSEARKVFASDMVQATNLLSDGDLENDNLGLSNLTHILLHSGYTEDAAIACSLVTTHLDTSFENIKNVLELYLCPDGVKPPEDSLAAGLLSWFSDNCKTEEKPRNKLKARVEELLAQYPPDKSDGPATPSSSTDGDAPTATGKEDDAGNAVDSARQTELNILKTIGKMLQEEAGRYCDSCDVLKCVWGFEKDFYRCKFCPSVDFCQDCMDKLKAQDPSKGHFICDPSHDWIHLPKWTPQKWMDAFTKTIRVPKKEEGLEGGEEIISVKDWLKKVSEPWGIASDDKQWDLQEVVSPLRSP
ncbi:hypothetical protein QBC35DRAFT_553730 [Podospora australis]|uniref:Fungal STAND N-terminal Goodbye domain-containing protein n=1 Tax=Podospora australis TaxID=1536484 RepID=A0AAN6X644_9PEZI|nr:hypothetical protein QBC35DRAFT_553730 [Podospora australis]